MKQSGGYISVESEVGIGTTFKCFLPRFKEECERKPVSVPRPVPQKGTESVLLVEDDRPLRELVRDFMLDLGYQVSTASDGAQALELIENTSGPIHLMITDLVIPRISGDQVAARMGQWHPETRVIYLSGHAHERIKGKLVAGARLLRKPFELSLLAQAMREVLDSPAQAGAEAS
jgi:DNA-binding response OmpR family regulator